jgi:hypothetical protein
MPDETTSVTTTETAQPEIQPQAQQPKEDDTSWQLERNTRVVNRAKDDPTAMQDLLNKIDAATGAISAIERDLAIERALRLHGLTDDDRELIDAPTPEGINAKAAKLAQRIPAKADTDPANQAQEITFPKHEFAPKNEWEAAQEMLRRHK